MAEASATPTEGAAGTTGGMPTEEPTIVVNDRTVKLSEAPQVLKEMEHSIKSGYDKKLAEERANTKALLDADIAWYASHPNPNYWAMYDPKVGGGSGFTGSEADLEEAAKYPIPDEEQQMSNNTPQNSAQGAFGKSPEIAALEAKIAALEQQTNSVTQVTYQSEVNRVAQERDNLMSKYGNADEQLVNLKLEKIWRETGAHPTRAVIEKIVKESHESTSKKIAAASVGTETKGRPSGTSSATPTVGGTPAAPDKPKPLSLERDKDTLVQRILATVKAG